MIIRENVFYKGIEHKGRDMGYLFVYQIDDNGDVHFRAVEKPDPALLSKSGIGFIVSGKDFRRIITVQ